ncbi:hypothetical protein PtB15_10B362 [Puccinia triticina]|nr:hypothetical protein PtB15_10B362 [Puccinia triticina]
MVAPRDNRLKVAYAADKAKPPASTGSCKEQIFNLQEVCEALEPIKPNGEKAIEKLKEHHQQTGDNQMVVDTNTETCHNWGELYKGDSMDRVQDSGIADVINMVCTQKIQALLYKYKHWNNENPRVKIMLPFS